TSYDLTRSGLESLQRCITQIATEVPTLRSIYDEHEGVRDRFNGAGIVTAALAARLGLTGLAGRASGQAFDLGVDHACEPYTTLAPLKCGQSSGDVAARIAIRFDEVMESCRLVRLLLEDFPPGHHRSTVPVPAEGSIGLGLIEGWRGPVLVALEPGPG